MSKSKKIHELGVSIAHRILEKADINLDGVSHDFKISTPFKDNLAFIMNEPTLGDPIKAVERFFFLSVPKKKGDIVALYEMINPDYYKSLHFNDRPTRLYYISNTNVFNKIGEETNKKLKDKLHSLSFSTQKK